MDKKELLKDIEEVDDIYNNSSCKQSIKSDVSSNNFINNFVFDSINNYINDFKSTNSKVINEESKLEEEVVINYSIQNSINDNLIHSNKSNASNLNKSISNLSVVKKPNYSDCSSVNFNFSSPSHDTLNKNTNSQNVIRNNKNINTELQDINITTETDNNNQNNNYIIHNNTNNKYFNCKYTNSLNFATSQKPLINKNNLYNYCNLYNLNNTNYATNLKNNSNLSSNYAYLNSANYNNNINPYYKYNQIYNENLNIANNNIDMNCVNNLNYDITRAHSQPLDLHFASKTSTNYNKNYSNLAINPYNYSNNYSNNNINCNNNSNNKLNNVNNMSTSSTLNYLNSSNYAFYKNNNNSNYNYNYNYNSNFNYNAKLSLNLNNKKSSDINLVNQVAKDYNINNSKFLHQVPSYNPLSSNIIKTNSSKNINNTYYINKVSNKHQTTIEVKQNNLTYNEFEDNNITDFSLLKALFKEKTIILEKIYYENGNNYISQIMNFISFAKNKIYIELYFSNEQNSLQLIQALNVFKFYSELRYNKIHNIIDSLTIENLIHNPNNSKSINSEACNNAKNIKENNYYLEFFNQNFHNYSNLPMNLKNLSLSLFEITKDNVLLLLKNKYIKNFFQLLITFLPVDKIIYIWQNSIFNNIIDICTDEISNHCVQSLISPNISVDFQKTIIKNFEQYFVTLSVHRYSTHIIQKFISVFDSDIKKSLETLIFKNFSVLSTNPNGVCVVKKYIACILKTNNNKISNLINFIYNNYIEILIFDKYGVFIISCLLENFGLVNCKKIVNLISNNIIDYSINETSVRLVHQIADMNNFKVS